MEYLVGYENLLFGIADALRSTISLEWRMLLVDLSVRIVRGGVNPDVIGRLFMMYEK